MEQEKQTRDILENNMKSNFKDNNKLIFSENEYTSIRTELIERIKLLNSQSFTVLATVVSFWAIGLTFKVQILDKISNLDLIQQILINFLSAIFFLIPIFIFIPLSAKSGENLLQIASLSAYIKVFHDYPVSTDRINTNWETSNNLLSKANVNRGKINSMNLYNEDYTILSIVSFIIYIIFTILNIRDLILLYQIRIIKLNVVIPMAISYSFISIISILSIILIHCISGMKNTLMKGTIYYTQAYIKRANELGIINNNDLQNAINELNPLKEFKMDNYYHLKHIK